MQSKEQVTLGKAKFIKHFAKKSDCTLAASEAIYDLFIDTLDAALKKGNAVRLNGIGTLKVVPFGARFYTNPTTGEPISKPAGKRLRFNMASAMKEALNNG